AATGTHASPDCRGQGAGCRRRRDPPGAPSAADGWCRRQPQDHLEHAAQLRQDRKSTRLNSSHVKISYAVFCLKKKTEKNGKSRSAQTHGEEKYLNHERTKASYRIANKDNIYAVSDGARQVGTRPGAVPANSVP